MFGNKCASSLDYVVRSTTLIILVLLVMDFPHIVLHIFPEKELPSVIIHMVFMHYLNVVPIIFVAYNPYHRRAVLRLLHRCLPPAIRRVLPKPTTASVVVNDTVEMNATCKFSSTGNA